MKDISNTDGNYIINERDGHKILEWCLDKSNVNAVIPNDIEEIAYPGFTDCRKLKTVVFAPNIKKIGWESFCNCHNLTVDIPLSVEEIEVCAFAGCRQMRSIFISKNVRRIEGGFVNAYVDELIVDPDNQVYDSRNGCNAIIETATDTLIQGCANTVMPNEIKHIGDNAFAFFPKHELVIPEGVESIGDSAFEYSKLTELVIPDSVRSIGEKAFYNCSNLERIYLPKNLKQIEEYTFWFCDDLRQVILPKDVQIGMSVFSTIPELIYY